MPKDIHVEPQRFAAQLISKLETVLREREAQERLEERLKRVRLVGQLRVVVHTVIRTALMLVVMTVHDKSLSPFILSHALFLQHLSPSVHRKKRGTMLTSP